MNDKCKYCDYVSKCSRICECDSYLCKVHRSFPKVVDKSYEQLQQENQQLQEELVSANESITWWNNRFNAVTRDNEQLKNKIKELVKYGYGTDMSLGEFKEFYKLGTGKDYDPKKCPEVE